MSIKTVIQTKYEYNSKDYILTLFLDEKDKAEYIFLENALAPSIAGSVYLATVETILPNTKGAFVKITDGRKAFLQLNPNNNYLYIKKNSKKNELCAGDEIIVEISRDAHKSKEAAATANVLYDGDNLIISSLDTKIGVSKKIEETKRKEIKESLATLSLPFGLIVRSSASSLFAEDLIAEAKAYTEKFSDIIKMAKNSVSPSLLYKRANIISTLILDNISSINKIVVSNADMLSDIKDNQDVLDKLSVYNDKEFSLIALYGINSIIDNAIKKTVHLKSGGNIIIEQMETLTAIDVNSSHNNKKKQSALELNLEACDAIYSEIKKRNIYGMILVDFLKMNKDDEARILTYMRSLFAKDIVSTNCLGFSRLGLLEITREKTYISIKDAFLI